MPPQSLLEDILEHKRRLVEEKRAFFSSLKQKFNNTQYSRYRLFSRMISQPGQVNLIAEIKKSSPSAGLIREDFDLLEIAKVFVQNKVAAISVLTEDKYFLGAPYFIKQISDQINIPLLTKDFIIDEGQIYEARFNGASAILLIVSILTDDQLKNLMEAAASVRLDCLVEVHTEGELKRALDAGAEIIGVNNRNLQTLELDPQLCETLIPKIPRGKIIVAESGFKTYHDIAKLKSLGANAVLIGETLMRERNIGKKIQELMYGRESQSQDLWHHQ